MLLRASENESAGKKTRKTGKQKMAINKSVLEAIFMNIMRVFFVYR